MEEPLRVVEHDVVVVGSANVDVVVRVPRFPRPGETITGLGLQMLAGGKGANQAVASARQGAATALVGTVGDDDRASPVLAVLEEAGVDLVSMRRADAPTGTAIVVVDDRGENQIVVVPGANGEMTTSEVEAALARTRARVLLTQLEIPLDAMAAALRCARAASTRTVLNAAPARELPDELLALVDVLVVNASEAGTLSSTDVVTADDAGRAAERLRDRGCREVVVTLGGDGALWCQADGTVSVEAFPVDVVDTVGAGDAFCGTLAASLATGRNRDVSLRRAAAAGALATTRTGAAPSIPDRAAVDALLR